MLGWFKKKFGKGDETEAGQTSLGGVPPQAAPVEPAPPPEQRQQPAVVPEGGRPAAEAAAADSDANGAVFLFRRLRERLAKTRDSFVSRVDQLFIGRKKIDADLYDELEEILITADLGAGTTRDLLDRTREVVKRRELSDPQALKAVLSELMLSSLRRAEKPAELVMPASGPFVIMVLGVNGVGKTTTIGKMAYKFKHAGQKVLLVAADTFRAAATEQLQVWGERLGIEVVAQQAGADPSSVVFDALEYAAPRKFDVVIVDTAGRLHTKVNLMEELKKLKRVMNRKVAGAPHEVLLVIDATTGQNAMSQARLFNEAVQITGLVLTKLDGTAKGGIIVNICHEFEIPIRFIGIGEKMADLRDFDPGEFVAALFGEGGGSSSAGR